MKRITVTDDEARTIIDRLRRAGPPGPALAERIASELETVTDETYNGWKNRETWSTALYLGNDQGLDIGAREAVAGLHYFEPTWNVGPDAGSGIMRRPVCKVCGADAGSHGTRPDDAMKAYVETLREYRDETDGRSRDELVSMFDDIGSLWRVDWRAVAAAFAEDAP
jgi:hypothetical protein